MVATKSFRFVGIGFCRGRPVFGGQPFALSRT
jgi:hypothetical protein